VRLVDLLVDRGFVTREIDPGDRRARLIRLTPPGRAEVDRIRARIYDIECRLTADLDEATLSILLDAFARIDARAGAILSR